MSIFRGLMMAVMMLLVCGAVQAQFPKKLFSKKNKHVYEEVDTEEMIRRFISKPAYASISIEGIYTVSAMVTVRKKALLSSQMKEKVVDRKDNYAQVAIIRDWSNSGSDFIEISMNQTDESRYPVVSSLRTLSEERGFLCKHTEPNGEVLTFTFTFSGDAELLEGTYTKIDGSKTITYNITYLKTFPKADGVTLRE